MRKKFKLTEEQKNIVDKVKNTDNLRLKINAYAGSGKTTTLIKIAEEMKNSDFLVLAFNKKIAEELKVKMSKNSAIYTTHSLAYFFEVGRNKKRGIKCNIINNRDFIYGLGKIFNVDYEDLFKISSLYDKYLNSEFIDITPENVAKLLDNRKFIILFNIKNKKELLYKADYFAEILKTIEQKIELGEIGYLHNYYLKKFQRNLFNYDYFFKEFDYIMVDEGQDLNLVQKYILDNINIKNKIIVGDVHQAIYSWRGAVNTLAKLKWEQMNLATSFRFKNKDIVNLSNKFLKNIKNDDNKIKMKKIKKDNFYVAHITRTNSAIIELIKNNDNQFKLLRPLNEIFRTIIECDNIIKYLKTYNEEYLNKVSKYIKNLILRYIEEKQNASIEDVMEYFKYIGDFEYHKGLKLALENNIEELYDKAKMLNNNYSKVVYTTAHTSKGLEFDTCIYSDDFPDINEYLAYNFQDKGILLINSIRNAVDKIKNNSLEFADVLDEINLQYVAITRAINNISGEGLKIIENNFNGIDIEKIYKMIDKKALYTRKKGKKKKKISSV